VLEKQIIASTTIIENSKASERFPEVAACFLGSEAN